MSYLEIDEPVESSFLEEIRSEVWELENNPSDPECDHVTEDELYVKALRYIAEGGEHSAEVAKAVLRTQDFITTRWYA